MTLLSEQTTANVKKRLPESEEAFLWASEAMQERNWGGATKRWSVLRLAYPEKPQVWIQAARAHQQNGELEQAGQLLARAREKFASNAKGWVLGAQVNAEQGYYDQALTLLDEAADRFPDEVSVWAEFAKVHRLAGHIDRAECSIKLLLKRFPEHPPGYVQKAELAMAREDWQEALDCWAEVRRRFPAIGAGYMRASAAAASMGDLPLSRQLRLAREYGNAWLEDILEGPEEAQHVISPPLRRDWRMFLDLVFTKARLNLKAEASKNYLHNLWWIIDPLLYMTVFYLVFGLLMHRGGEGYIGYLLTGIVPFQWFAKTIQNSSNSIVAGKGLMHKVRISPLFFPLVAITQNTGKQIPVFLMLGGFLIVYGLPPTVHWLAFIPVVLTQLLLMVVVSCLVAMAIPFIRDLSNLVPTGVQFLLFVSGIFYSVDRIPEQWHTLFFSNPIANILYQYRLIFVENQWPEWDMLGWVVLGSLIGLGIVLWLYRRLEQVFPRVVIG